MPKGRAWRTGELCYLRQWSGKKSLERMHTELGRSKRAIETQMQRMGLPWRHWESDLVWCPTCCAWRTRLIASRCPVCSRRDTRDRLIAKEHELLSQLSQEALAKKKPELHQSRVDRMPVQQSTDGISPYWAAKIEDLNAIRTEAWQVGNLDRENAARRRRVERLQDELKSFGIK